MARVQAFVIPRTLPRLDPPRPARFFAMRHPPRLPVSAIRIHDLREAKSVKERDGGSQKTRLHRIIPWYLQLSRRWFEGASESVSDCFPSLSNSSARSVRYRIISARRCFGEYSSPFMLLSLQLQNRAFHGSSIAPERCSKIGRAHV